VATYDSYDPRDAIRQKIGTSRWDKTEQKTVYEITATDDKNRTIHIPMLLSENCQADNAPEFPYIKMHRAYVLYEPHNVRATVRKMTAYIDMKLYLANTDNIIMATLKDEVLGTLQSYIRTNQEGVTGTFFMNIEEERDVEEIDGRQVIFVYIITLKCDFSDAC
jgi:hypothetical protein